MTELKLYKSPWKAVKLLLACSVFVGGGIFLLHQPDVSRLGAWLCISFFGLGIPISLFQLLDRRPQIIINEVGVFDRTAHHEFINWEVIHDAYLVELNRQQFICLVVDEAFEPSQGKSKFKQQLAGLGKDLGFQELNLSLGFLSVDAMRLAELILAMRGAGRPEREALVRTAIANL